MTETRGRVGIIKLHRPEALNALCNGLFIELNRVLREFDDSKEIGAVVLTGSERAFAGNCSHFCLRYDKLLHLHSVDPFFRSNC